MRKYFCVRKKREYNFVNSNRPLRVGFGETLLSQNLAPKKFLEFEINISNLHKSNKSEPFILNFEIF